MSVCLYVRSLEITKKLEAVAGRCGIALCTFALILSTARSIAQATVDSAQGESQMATYLIGDIDNVNPASGNVYLNIPLLSYPQRGHLLRLNFRIYYNNKNWGLINYPVVLNSDGGFLGPIYWSAGDHSGPTNQTIFSGTVYVARDQHLSFATTTDTYPYTGGSSGYGYYQVNTTDLNYSVYENNGAHHYYYDEWNQNCTAEGGGVCPATAPFESAGGVASDSSGFAMTGGAPYSLTGPDGVMYSAIMNGSYTTPYDNISDPAGNTIQTISTGQATGWIDSLGRAIPGSGPSNAYQVYPAPDLMPGMPESTSSLCPAGTVSSRIWTVPSIGQGATQNYHFCFSTVTWQTNFQYTVQVTNTESTPAQEASGSAQLLTAIVLPNRQMYTFAYDPQYSSLAQITLPTGGSVQYQWAPVQPSNPNWGNSPLTLALQSRTVIPGNNQPNRTWTYHWFYLPTNPAYQQYVGIITDPAGNDVERGIGQLGITYMKAYAGCSPNDNAQNDGATDPPVCNSSQSTLLREEDYTLSRTASLWSESGPSFESVIFQAQPTTTTVTLPSSQGNRISQTVTTLAPGYSTCSTFAYPYPQPNYYVNNQTVQNCYRYTAPQTIAHYDFGAPGSGQPGALLSQTATTYKYQTTSSFLTANLLNLPDTVTVSNGSQTLTQTQYGYDSMGDQTSVTRGLGADQASTVTAYNAQAMPTQVTDPAGNVTTYAYDATGLFLKSVQHPATGSVQHNEAYSFDANTGKVLSHTDENNQTTTYLYTDPVTGAVDPLNRVRQIIYPPTFDGASTTATQGFAHFNYQDTPGSLSVQTQQLMSSAAGTPASQTTYYDGVGDTIRTSLDSDPQGAILVDTNYDLLGRKSTVTNPYRAISGQRGISTYAYNDGLGRVTSLSQPDGSAQHWSYDGSTTSFTDESGNTWARTADGLGRLTTVVEPNQAVTAYMYDASNNLTLTTQGTATPPSTPCTATAGLLQRCFSYDSLSRLISSNNPETGATGYTYSENGSRCAGDVSAPCSKTDARGRTTTYTYDPLNRMLSKFAPGAYTASKGLTTCFLYDTNGGSAVPNGIGQLTAEWTQVGTCPSALPGSGYFSLKQIGSYDARGRVLTESMQTCTASQCAAVRNQTYTYDIAGDLKSYTDGLGLNTFTQGYDAAKRLTSLTSSYVDSTHPSNLFIISSFDPVGWVAATMGSAASLTQSFDNRNRIAAHSVTAGVQ